MAHTLYWLTHDLRLDDNPALLRAALGESLLLVYCVNPDWFVPGRLLSASMGAHRLQFLREALVGLSNSLNGIGQHLLILEERPQIALARLVRQNAIQRLVCSSQFGMDEKCELQALAKNLPDLEIEEVDTYTLFNRQAIDSINDGVLTTYSRFRRQAEKWEAMPVLPTPERLPPPPKAVIRKEKMPPNFLAEQAASEKLITGGERAAQEHLAQYFAGDLPLSYKAVRNELDGFNNSSKMSSWLNMGCLSIRRLRWTVEDYESKHGGNESTYWLFVELLWREYFLWLALHIESQLFSFHGAAAQPPMTKFQQEKFECWCKGDTPYPLVNACMRQLNRSGFLSNRGRQIAASCFVNELAQDWRYGAAFFEQQLVDYNVAVNWGNWQYIAGVGADPRGGRHFNLKKQTELYDANGEYRRRWARS
jgi:deoxyribodipyrimidine photo-lyase